MSSPSVVAPSNIGTATAYPSRGCSNSRRAHRSSIGAKKIADLTVLVEQQGSLSPELDAALVALKTQVQVVDDLVPDAPAV